MTIAQQLNIKDFPFQIFHTKFFYNGNPICPIYYENSNNEWCRNEYDEMGNQTYHINSKGYWEKSEYDGPSRCTRKENSNGYINKHTYNEANLCTYFESISTLYKPSKFWDKYEYSEDNRFLLYRETSDGDIDDFRSNPQKI
jgi:hypothetical protein